MCTDLETRVVDHVNDQLANQGYIGYIIPEPRQYVDSYLHVTDAFLRFSGHPAGKEIDANIYYSRVMSHKKDSARLVRYLATRILGCIVNTACFFGMFEDKNKDGSSLVPFTDYYDHLEIEPDVRSWATFLRARIAPILTLRWPDWQASDMQVMISNDIIKIADKTNAHIRYMQGAFFFFSEKGPITKGFFGRTNTQCHSADIHVFKDQDVAGLSWDEFVARLDSFEVIDADQCHIFHSMDDFREYMKTTLDDYRGST